MKSSKFISPLLSCQALKELLKSPPKRISILEADMGKQFEKEYKAAHIPQARYFDQLECTQPTKLIPRGLPETKCFESYLSRLGVSDSDHIVLYDRSPMGFYASTRAWWLFKTYGVNNLSILNGGFAKWLKETNKAESSDSDKIPSKPDQKGKFTVRFNEQMIKSYDDIVNLVSIKSKEPQLVDARSPNAFYGEKAGHIPGSLNLPYTELFDQENQGLKSNDDLKKVFEEAGVDLSKQSIYTCQTGTTASALAFAAYILGQQMSSVYNGSFTEWQQRAPPELIARTQTGTPAA